MPTNQLKILTVLTVLLAVTLIIVSFFGAFVSGTYERDSASMAAQGKGQDLVDLFFVVPLLFLSLIFMQRNNKVACFIYGGTIFYILYSFFIYCFGVNFNKLFLLYCLTLGLSLYSFILFMGELNRMDVHKWFGENVPTRSIGIYLLIVAAMFYLLWFKDIIPAILNNSIPASVSDNNLLVNPVHVLDIAFALPGLIIATVLLLKKHRLGYILAPIFLVFTIILAIALTGMVIMLKLNNISENISIAFIFIFLAIISFIFLFLFLKNI
ncbi:hypothetical protein H8E88_19570 [candidate division KSB1 bacterium]|nr:hypothetical protein [candidate division KSB1 bacterium]MBL7093165.1 hypothetical protein [candidate division KSB1 bacterium]